MITDAYGPGDGQRRVLQRSGAASRVAIMLIPTLARAAASTAPACACATWMDHPAGAAQQRRADMVPPPSCTASC
ncbi:hypothetical protein M8494_16650 [Serratia ureilytica]